MIKNQQKHRLTYLILRDDNRLDNLELVSVDEHMIITKLEEENAKLREEIAALRK